MGKLVYTTLCSLDGYIEDRHGTFDWAAPDEEVHAFCNQLERDIGIHLYGRRMYEVMKFWETVGDAEPPVMREFAQTWRSAEKIVYSSTLEDAPTERTRIARQFDIDTTVDLVREAQLDVSIGGANLAAQAFRAGVVDECHLLLTPVIVGAGKRALPQDVRIDLQLLDHRRFASGVVYVRYAVRR
jgi:dihydrofolate reductase